MNCKILTVKSLILNKIMKFSSVKLPHYMVWAVCYYQPPYIAATQAPLHGLQPPAYSSRIRLGSNRRQEKAPLHHIRLLHSSYTICMCAPCARSTSIPQIHEVTVDDASNFVIRWQVLCTHLSACIPANIHTALSSTASTGSSVDTGCCEYTCPHEEENTVWGFDWEPRRLHQTKHAVGQMDVAHTAEGEGCTYTLMVCLCTAVKR